MPEPAAPEPRSAEDSRSGDRGSDRSSDRGEERSERGRRERPSIRTLLETEFKRANEAQTETAKFDAKIKADVDGTPPPADDKTPRQLAVEDRPRNADGTFAPVPEGEQAAPSAATPAVDAAPAAPQAPVPETTPVAQPAAGIQKPLGPPPGWSPEAKAAYASLPPAVQQAVLKREEEVSTGFKTKSDELKQFQEQAKQYRDLDEAFKPYEQMFRAHGRSNADVTKQLLNWFSLLSNQNPQVRSNGLKTLAASFNIDVGQPAPAPQSAAEASPQPTDPTQPTDVPADIRPLIEQYVKQYISPLEQRFADLSQSQINEHLAAWSVDKPHFDKVKQLMGTLIQSGQIPVLPNGRPDLDYAYGMATRANAEVFAEISRVEQEKQAAEAAQKIEEARLAAVQAAEDKRLAEEATKRRAAEAAQTRVAQAKKAGVSVSGNASPSPASPPRSKKGLSVKESLMAAIEEHRA